MEASITFPYTHDRAEAGHLGLVYDFTDKAADASIMRAASHSWLRKQAIQMLVSSLFHLSLSPDPCLTSIPQ